MKTRLAKKQFSLTQAWAFKFAKPTLIAGNDGPPQTQQHQETEELRRLIPGPECDAQGRTPPLPRYGRSVRRRRASKVV